MIKVLLLRAFRSIKKKDTVSSALVLSQHFASSPFPHPSLEQSYGWYSLCMHMLSCPILDLLIKIEGKMKRILRANNFDVDIQMRSCEVLWREMRAALRSAPILRAQINIKGEPAPHA